MSLQDPRAVLAQVHQNIGGHLAYFLKSPNIQKLQNVNHLANTMFPVQTFCNAIFWKFTLGFYHLRFFKIQLLIIKFEECHTKNMFNVERTKISNLWLCAFPLNKYYSYPFWQNNLLDSFVSCWPLFVGHCGGLPNIFFTTIPHFSWSHYQSVKFIIPPLCIICDKWWRYYTFQIKDASNNPENNIEQK